jgi:hypothetical protein
MLSTLDKIKSLLQIPLDDTAEDEQLIILLTSASCAIESFCGRTFRRQDRTQTASGGGHYLTLRNYPVHSIQEITGPCGPISDYTKLDHGVLFRKYGWPEGLHAIQVAYNAGYTLPGDSTPEIPADLPSDLEYACLLFVKMLYQNQFGLHSERLGDHSVTFLASKEGDNIELPQPVRALAAPHVGRLV